MAHYVIDASVGVEYLLRTQLGETVTELVESSRLAAPELFDLEILSAVRGFVLRGELSREDALVAIAALFDWSVERISHRDTLFATWRYYLNVSTYDAVYIAIAQNLGVEVLTADSKLARAPGIDVAVHDIRNPNVLAQLETR